MGSREGRAVAARVEKELDRVQHLSGVDRSALLDEVPAAVAELRKVVPGHEIKDERYFDLLCRAGGLLSDAASESSRMDLLQYCAEIFKEVSSAPVSGFIRGWAGYCLGTTLAEQVQVVELGRRGHPPIDPMGYRVRWEERVALREARLLLASAGHSDEINEELRSKALCNLGNELDSSGRWLEAYEAYKDALTEYPDNGNAAGNLAELLAARIRLGRRQTGHYAALHQKYATMAKSLRAQTVAVANEATAQRWDSLPTLENVGHEAHVGDANDPYQSWIVRHRLALSFAMEGLGSDGPTWDDADVESVIVASDSTTPDAIFAALNVLKAEYLVARRLAFEGGTELLEGFDGETGTYATTDGDSYFGQPTAKLVLAQRATLDVLDKIAVVANLHFEIGDTPSQVKFRDFWTERKSPDLRAGLPRFRIWPDYALTLGELAFDIDDDGLYARAQQLRNAGTHRLVYARSLQPSGPSREAVVTISRDELLAANLQALHVTRAAYLYLFDFIAEEAQQVAGIESAVDPVQGVP
jgi:hypothetical protein